MTKQTGTQLIGHSLYLSQNIHKLAAPLRSSFFYIRNRWPLYFIVLPASFKICYCLARLQLYESQKKSFALTEWCPEQKNWLKEKFAIPMVAPVSFFHRRLSYCSHPRDNRELYHSPDISQKRKVRGTDLLSINFGFPMISIIGLLFNASPTLKFTPIIKLVKPQLNSFLLVCRIKQEFWRFSGHHL